VLVAGISCSGQGTDVAMRSRCLHWGKQMYAAAMGEAHGHAAQG